MRTRERTERILRSVPNCIYYTYQPHWEHRREREKEKKRKRGNFIIRCYVLQYCTCVMMECVLWERGANCLRESKEKSEREGSSNLLSMAISLSPLFFSLEIFSFKLYIPRRFSPHFFLFPSLPDSGPPVSLRSDILHDNKDARSVSRYSNCTRAKRARLVTWFSFFFSAERGANSLV